MTGDFNINYEDLDGPDKLSLDDLLNAFSYKQLVKCVTLISRHSIYLILTREQDDFITLNPEQSQLLSNHYFVRAILNIKHDIKKQKKITCRNISKIDMDFLKKRFI